MAGPFTPSEGLRKAKYTLSAEDISSSSSSTSTTRNQSRFLYYREILDKRENRNAEFKLAQGSYIYDILPSAVEKYGCAFANGEGGSLYLGIRDDGMIIGIDLTLRDEETILRTVERVFQKFLPRSPLNKVHMIPLYSRQDGSRFQYRSVVEISINAGTLSDIFETKDHKVFIKRDGSVELQNALQIKDLAITKYKQMLQQRS